MYLHTLHWTIQWRIHVLAYTTLDYTMADTCTCIHYIYSHMLHCTKPHGVYTRHGRYLFFFAHTGLNNAGYMYLHTLHVLAYATLTCTYIHYMYSHMLHYTMPADDHGVYSHKFLNPKF